MASGNASIGQSGESLVPERPSSPEHSASRDREETSHPADAPDAPDAPPPPPLPPPPPPQAPHGSRKKRRVRSFYWKTIPEEKVRGKPNIWTLAVRQQHYQIDVRSVEELFGQQEEARAHGATRSPRTGTGRGALKESKEEISILDSKRGMNLGIFLKQFKKSHHALVEDIRLGNTKHFGLEPLKELLKLLPEEEEVKKLKEFHGDPERLTMVDSFMFLLIQVPCFDVRIEAMVLQEEFSPSCSAMSRELNVVRLATEELMTCEELHAILHLVLQAGNIMNQGGYAGNAVGFKLSSLLSLADTKANKPGMNLLHFVALEAQKKDENLLKFPEKLTHVQSAARISVENIDAELSSLSVRMQALEEKIERDPQLLLQLNPFVQSSTQTLEELKQCRLNLRSEGNVLIDFFCEDKDTFKLDECFRIFQDFCLKFEKAVKDNLAREMKEAARQQRLRELEERRIAWAATGGDQGGGNFGRSSSENDVGVLTKDGLLDFLLHPRPHSPHSPLGRSASARRYRHATADRNLRGYLELFSGSPTAEIAKFSSLPRSGRHQQRRTITWLATADDNRELGPHPATSPKAQTEPISPLAQYSTSGDTTEIDVYGNNNNNHVAISEGIKSSQPGHNRNCMEKSHDVGHMNVSVEKHTLVSGPQSFDLSHPNHNNNSTYTPLDNQVDTAEREGEKEQDLADTLFLDTPPSSRGSEEAPEFGAGYDTKIISLQKEEEEENSTVSSTTCDTPLPLDPLLSNKKAAPYILDCTEADCSVMLDVSELESAPVCKEGAQNDIKPQDRYVQSHPQDPSSLSSNFESLSINDPSVSASGDEPFEEKPAEEHRSVTTDEADSDNGDLAEGKKVGEKAVPISRSKPANLNTKNPLKPVGTRTGRPARTLTPTETRHLRKVVPITKVSRSGSSAKRVESTESRRPLRDQSMPARKGEKQGRPARHSSLPPESKAGRGTTATPAAGSQLARDSTPHRPSIKRPTAKPVRNIPKPPVEEKICRSTMRALAQAQAASDASAPQTPNLGRKSASPLPGFARNTFAFSSRAKKDLIAQPAPGTPVKNSNLSRTSSLKVPSGSKAHSVSSGHSAQGEDKQTGSIRRVQSVRASGRNTLKSNAPPPQSAQEQARKGSSYSEKSFLIKDSTSGRAPKPMWK